MLEVEGMIVCETQLVEKMLEVVGMIVCETQLVEKMRVV
jgi:hypothetical protein